MEMNKLKQTSQVICSMIKLNRTKIDRQICTIIDMNFIKKTKRNTKTNTKILYMMMMMMMKELNECILH